MASREIENLMPMKEPADKTRMRRLEAEDSDVPENELIELVLKDIGLEYIPKRAICVQKY
jgi:hypothetical protein